MERTVRAILRAETGQYESAMGRAAQATEQVGAAAQGAAKQTQQSTQQQTSAARTFSQGLVQSARENERAWTTVGATMAAAGGAIVGLGAAAVNTGIQYNTLQQTTSSALHTMLGDMEAVNAQMAEFNAFASESPYARQTWLTAQQQLLGFGVEAERVIPILQGVEDAIAAMGGGNQEIEAVVYALAQMEAQGRLTGQTLNQVGQYGIDMASIIAEQTGRSSEEIRKMAMSPGGIPVEEIWDPLLAGLQQNFGGAAEGLKDTFEGAMDRVKAVWRDVGAFLAEPLVSAEGGGFLVDLANNVADLGRAFLALPGPVKGAAAVLGGVTGVAAALGGAFMLLAPRAVAAWDALGAMGQYGKMAQTGLAGLVRTVGPIIGKFALFSVAAAGAGAAVQAIQNHFRDAELSAEQLQRAMSNLDFDAPFERLSGAYGDFESALTVLFSDNLIDRVDRGMSAINQALGGFFPDDVALARGYLDDMIGSLNEMVAAGDAVGAWEIGEQMLDQVNKMADAGEISREAASEIIESLEGIKGAAQDQEYAEMWDRIIGKQESAKESAAEVTAEWEALLEAGRATARGLMDTGDMFADGWNISSLNEDLKELTANLEAMTSNMESLHGRLSDLSIDSTPVFSFMDEMDTATQAQYLAYLRDLTDEELVVHLEIIADKSDADEAFAEIDAMARNTPTDPITFPTAYDPEGLMTIPELDDPPTVTVEADTGPGSEQFNALVESMGATPPVDVTIGANPDPAIRVFNETTGAWENITTETLLDLNPDQAVLVFNRETGEWQRTSTATLLDLDPSEAVAKFGGTTADWADTTTDTRLGLDTSNADAAVQSFINRYHGKTIATASVDVYTRLIDQGVSRGMAASGSRYTAMAMDYYGYAHGGYTGDGGKYEPAGIVHRGEWVTTKEHTADPFNRQLLEAIHAGQNLRAALTGYAGGGQVGASQPARTFVPTPTPATPRPAQVSAGPSAGDIRAALEGMEIGLTGMGHLVDGTAKAVVSAIGRA